MDQIVEYRDIIVESMSCGLQEGDSSLCFCPNVDRKESNNYIESLVESIKYGFYITSIIYFWICFMNLSREVVEHIKIISHFIWLSLKFTFHVSIVILYVYHLFMYFKGVEQDYNINDVMFTVGSIEYIFN